MGWLVYIVASMCLLLEEEATADTIEFRQRSCPRCGYDLAGLPERSPCPECGGEHWKVTVPAYHTKVVLRRGVLVFWLATLLVICTVNLGGVGQGLYAEATVQSYTDMGYTRTVAENAAWNRELRGNRALLGAHAATLAVAWTPFIGFVARGRWRYVFLLAVTLASLALVFLVGFSVDPLGAYY